MKIITKGIPIFKTEICVYCKKQFDVHSHNQKYCSYECSKKANYHPIKIILSDEEYRLRKRIRDNCQVFTKSSCEICGSKEKLERHHVQYVPEKVITLCIKCHNRQHKALRRLEK